MGYRYLILGAGRQGTACAYDLALFGEADRIILADANESFARKSADRLRHLLPSKKNVQLEAVAVSVQNHPELVNVLRGAAAVMSAVSPVQRAAFTSAPALSSFSTMAALPLLQARERGVAP